jgi:hypothetical protein
MWYVNLEVGKVESSAELVSSLLLPKHRLVVRKVDPRA